MKYPARVAKELADRHNTKNPYTIADSIGVKIFKRDLGDPHQEGTALGVYIDLGSQNSPKLIFINDHLPEHAQTAICAHELAHAMLHSNLNTAQLMTSACFAANAGTIEHQANIFAAELLLPDAVPDECQEFSWEQLSVYFGVPLTYVMLKKWS